MERKLKRTVNDTRVVDLNDDYALEFWANEFNVSFERLREAVRLVGLDLKDLKRELKK